MPNLSEYIVPSSDVQINMTFSGIPSMKLDTGSRLNWANSQSVQDIFAISHVDPIGIVALNATYTASVTIRRRSSTARSAKRVSARKSSSRTTPR